MSKDRLTKRIGPQCVHVAIVYVAMYTEGPYIKREDEEKFLSPVIKRAFCFVLAILNRTNNVIYFRLKSVHEWLEIHTSMTPTPPPKKNTIRAKILHSWKHLCKMRPWIYTPTFVLSV